MKKNIKSSGEESKLSGPNETKKVPKITSRNYDDIKIALKRFLILEIERYAMKAGNREELSLLLGRSGKKVQMTLNRGSFASLERLWRDCRGYYKED